MELITRRSFVGAAATLIAAGFVATATGCGSKKTETKQDGTFAFTDDAGREVQIPNNVKGIVPSGHTTTFVLLPLCADKLASVSQELSTDLLKFIKVDGLKDLPVTGAAFGNKGDLNKETVAGLGDAANMILIDSGELKSGVKEDLDKLQEQLGITCVFVEAKLNDYASTYTKLGKITGCEDRAKVLADYCSKAYKESTEPVANVTKRGVAYITNYDGINAIAKGSYQGGVIDLVADNVVVVEKAAGNGIGNSIDMEQLAIWDPEVILFQSQGMFDSIATDASWQTLSAVKNNSYYVVPSNPVCWLNNPPTVNQVMGLQWLPRLLYPAQFKDSIADVTKSYYKTFYQYDLSDAEVADITKNAVVK